MTEITYGRLEEILRGLGFRLSGVEENNNVFVHDATGALLTYPQFPPDKPVLSRHRLAVRSVLQAYGIGDPTDFGSELEKVT